MLKGRLARAGAWLFASSVITGVLGYVFQILMGRMLSAADYGLFSALMALFMIFGAPLGTLMMVVSRKVSEYRAQADDGSLAHFYYSINARTAAVGIATLALCALFAPTLQAYLGSASIVPVYLLGALLFLTFPIVVNNAFLQGTQRFIWLSASTASSVAFKIVFATAFVWMGLSVSGALAGTILAAVAGWLFTYGALHRMLRDGLRRPSATRHLSFRPFVPVFVANAAFATMTQLDIILVNHYFSGPEAGLYAAASVLGKAIMYLPGGIAMALFPMVAERHSRDESSAHLFVQAVGLTALLCGGSALFYYLFGEWLIVVLYGEGFRPAGQILALLGFAMLPMGLVLVAEHFLIAKGRVLFAYLFIVSAPAQAVGFHIFHDSLQAIVAVVGVSGLVVLAGGYGLLWRSYKLTQAIESERG
jgi:O-antigen/teichoic acid export membrane protein